LSDRTETATPGVRGAEARQHSGDESGRRAGHRELQLAAIETAQLRQRVVEPHEHREDLEAVCVRAAAGLGQADLPADLLEQRHAERLAQLLDLRRDRRLREVELVGGAGEAR
jgi:hypothetical protein